MSAMPKCKDKLPRRTMTAEEVRAFEDAAKGERLEALFTVAFDNGLRPGEMTAVLWSDLDLDASPPLLTLSGAMHRQLKQRPASEVKDGESRFCGYEVVRGALKRSTNPNRIIELSPEAVTALRAHKSHQAAERLRAGVIWQDHGLVFTSEVGTPIDPSGLRRAFARIAKRAGIDGAVFPYAARHTTASLLIDSGVSVEEVADLFGDDPMTVFRHYRHRVKKVSTAGTRMRGALAAK